MATDETSIRAAGDNISDGRLDRQGANIAQVTYRIFLEKTKEEEEKKKDGIKQAHLICTTIIYYNQHSVIKPSSCAVKYKYKKRI